jgi:hypothetical protein
MSFIRSRGKSLPSITGSKSPSPRCFTSSRSSEHRLWRSSFLLRLPFTTCCYRIAPTSALAIARCASATFRASINLSFTTLRSRAITTKRCAPSQIRYRYFGFFCASSMEFCLKYQWLNKSSAPATVGTPHVWDFAAAVHSFRQKSKVVERVTGIEPAWPVWKTGTLPLSYTRNALPY